MSGQERREQIVKMVRDSKTPVSGAALARQLGVSRQVIVQDMALLRANGQEILSTHRGYILQERSAISRVFKVHHTGERVEEELNLFVDLGARVEDVFVYHKVHGVIRAALHIRSRRDVQTYLQEIASGSSTQLLNLTAGYHYHTVTADSETVLDMIQEELEKKGMLARLQDYEPVDFWNGNKTGQ